MASQFSKLFNQFYNIHATIHTILHETNGGPVEESDVARRVRDTHPDLNLEPGELSTAIQQAIADARLP